MKKIFLIGLISLLILTMAGCIKNKSDDCCECKDCPICDVCCSCKHPYLNK